jgi:hypothetical protein
MKENGGGGSNHALLDASFLSTTSTTGAAAAAMVPYSPAVAATAAHTRTQAFPTTSPYYDGGYMSAAPHGSSGSVGPETNLSEALSSLAAHANDLKLFLHKENLLTENNFNN